MKTTWLRLLALPLLAFSLATNASLVAHWPGDGNASDVVGGNDGSTTNVSYSAGQIGQAFSFDGTGQIVVAPKALAFGTSDFSLAFWIQTTGHAGAIADLCGDNTLTCALTPEGQIALAVADTNGLSCAAVSVAHVNDGTFHHVIAERHATDLMIYVDGALSALSTCDGIVDLSTNFSIVTDPDSGETFTNISAATFGGNTCDDGFAGALDDIRTYDTALDANEAYLLMHPDAKLAIVTQPFNQRTLANHTVVFNVVGVGIEPITYQWQLNGRDIPGAVSHYYEIDSAQAADAGTYTAIVSNPYTNLTSIAATLYVTNGPSLDQYLVSRLSGEGTTLDSISGHVGSGANLSYAPGVLGTAFRFNGQTAVDCGNVFGPLGYNDFTYEFWIKTTFAGYAETIMSQRDICNVAPMVEFQWDATRHFLSWQFAGQAGTYIIGTSGGIPVTVNDGVFHHVAAVRKGNAITLFIDGIRGPTSAGPAADLGTLPPNLVLGRSCCDGNNQVGFNGMLDEIVLYNRALSDAEVFSTYQPNPSLLIVTQPQSTQAIEGTTATLSVAVTGQQPYSFQWQFQGQDISGATDSAYTLNPVSLSASGDYSVKVSNTAENVTSAAAHVAVVPASGLLPGLVNKWSAEGNGVDLLGTANLSALNGSFAPGVVGQAFSFDGDGNFISFNNCGDFGSGDFTVDFWERAANSGNAVLISRPFCYRILKTGGDASFQLTTDAGMVWVQTTRQNISDGQFHHIAAVRQDTNLLVYVDGALAGQANYPYIGTVNTSIFGFELADDDATYPRFAGQLDEIELYSRALSASDIASLYSAAFNSPRAQNTPQFINTSVGSSVTLTLPSVSGEGPFTYQWQLNGVAISGQTGTTLLTTVALDGAGVYTCVVTGPGGSTTIPVATISIQLAPGSYNGLFYFDGAPDDDTSGYITLTVTKNQTYTGSIMQHGARTGFTGKFHANRSIALLKGGVSISLVAESNGTEARLKGIVRKNGKNIPLAANRAIYNAKKPTPQAGSYTLSLQGQDSATAPTGDGFGNVTILPNGTIRLGTTLADGWRATQTAALATSGTWPLYCQLYGGHGSVLGWLSFTNQSGTRCVGNLRWIKSSGGTNYQNGFAAKVSVVGSAFHPHSGSLGINLNGGSMVLSGGKLPTDVVNPIVGTNFNTIVCKTSSSTVNLSVTPKFGQFSGTIIQDGTPVTVKGIAMQDQSVATGYFIRNGVSGRVAISQ